MPTLRRSAKKDAAAVATGASPTDLEVDESSRALEPVATNLESIHTNPDDGSVDAVGVVNDAKEVGAPRKKSDDAKTGAIAPQGRSKLPTPLQFPLVTILSLSVSSLCYSFLNERSGGELARVGKSLDTWGEVCVLAGWRIFELALGWFGSFDSLDLASLNLLAHGPAFFLLATFYNISLSTVLAGIGIEMLSTFLPFQLLRPLSGFHAFGSDGAATTGGKAAANREIVSDVPIAAYTTLLSSIIYGIVLFTSLHSYLPTSFVLYFEGIPSLAPAYSATYLSLLPVVLAFGIAARSFIFTPFAATGRSREDARLREFDPVTATLGETVWFNLWGYTTRAKVIIVRTGVAMLVTGVNTYLQTLMTVAGVESKGAAGYAGAWTAATFLTGVALAFVGGES